MNVINVIETSCQLYNPQIAATLGLNEAVVLQQIHYWLKKSTHYIDERKWTYNTIDQWREKDFPFWCYNTLQNIFRSLEKKGILIARNYNSISSNKTKWYSIDYEILNSLVNLHSISETQVIEETPLVPLTQDLGQALQNEIQGEVMHREETPLVPLTQDLGEPNPLTQDLGIDDPRFGSSISESSSYNSKQAVSERRECERGDSEPPPINIQVGNQTPGLRGVKGDRESTRAILDEVKRKLAEDARAQPTWGRV